MTRKEPQFNDELSPTSALSEPGATGGPNMEIPLSVLGNEPKSVQTGSQWLLWLFVMVSLFVSFGMAFFGLEEAGRYKAALDNAERQAAKLEETIDRLNQIQIEGIGELAQSDAQMRQMMKNVENKLLKEFSTEIQSASKRSDVFSSSMAAFNADLTLLGTKIETLQSLMEDSLDRSQSQQVAEQNRLDGALKELEANATKIQMLVKMGEQSAERISTMTEDLNRTEDMASQAIDGKTALFAIEIISEEIVALRADLRDYGLQIEKLFQADVQTVGSLESLSEKLNPLATTQAKLSEVAQMISQFEVRRQQLTQRVVDFEKRWDAVNKLQQTIGRLEQRQDNVQVKIDSSSRAFEEMREELNELRVPIKSQ